MSSSLLPPSSTKLERNLEQIISRSSEINPHFETIWNPWACPQKLLPWLAWAVGVKEWSLQWPEQRQRQAIARSMGIRKTAGTVASMRSAISALGIDGIQYTEWHEYGGTPGTYRIRADLEDRGMTEDQYEEFLRVVRTAGRLSAWLDQAGFTVIGRGYSRYNTSSSSGIATTILPLRRAGRISHGVLFKKLTTRSAVSIGVLPVLNFALTSDIQKRMLVAVQAINLATLYPTGD